MGDKNKEGLKPYVPFWQELNGTISLVSGYYSEL
jgi:hypothetical protein